MYSRTFLGKLICGLCALCGVFILTLPIPIVVSSFAQCYKRKLWRNEIATRRRMASKLVQIVIIIYEILTLPWFRLKKTEKSDILFNLSTSGGLSGVRKISEVFPNHLSDIPEYEKLIKLQNKILMDTRVDKKKQRLSLHKWLKIIYHLILNIHLFISQILPWN